MPGLSEDSGGRAACPILLESGIRKRDLAEKIERGIKGILDAIKDGLYQPAMKARMSELEQQKAEIEKRLAEAPADMPDVHPNIAEHYRAKVIRLAETLAEPESNGEAREDI